MHVRSITFFTPIDPFDPQPHLEPLAQAAAEMRETLNARGFTVQTVRLALPPWHTWGDDRDVYTLALYLNREAPQMGFDYTSLGTLDATQRNQYARLQILNRILEATQTIFCSVLYASVSEGIHINVAREIAALIRHLATVEENGFANLRFAALANVPPYSPFFPAAYAHPKEPPAVALALECGDLLVEAYTDADTLGMARARLAAALESHGRTLTIIMDELAQRHNLIFKGLDFSMAPFPTPDKSTAAGIEALGASPFGAPGTLMAAALTTDALRRARFLHTGFNGLMLPVLEDAILAARAGETYSVHDLLLYSAVCGTGLDTVPLPGDVSERALTGLLLDVAALAVRLNKPLTARLMPIPGKQAGDLTDFNFEYFANGRVLHLHEPGEGALWQTMLDEIVELF